MIDLHGKTAVITGASRGIGAATALLMAEAGADIVIAYRRDKRSALRIAAEVKEKGVQALTVQGNVENPSDAKRIVSAAMRKFGGIDILVNSAGIWEYGEIGAMSLRDWKKTMDINLGGTFNMCGAAVPVMKRRKYGRIVNVSSTAGQRGEAFHSHYAASKGGVIAFSKSIAIELAPYGIGVNCVAPGWVDTDMVASVMKKTARKNEIVRTIPRGRVPSALEIAGPILFLSSGLADHVIGEVLNINGGSLLCG